MPPFSVIIPSWNNLPYLKLCIDSIRKNSAVQHQIIVHVNEGSDGTLDYVREQGIDYTFSDRNIGVCLACNTMRTKVRTDYIFYVNDDMYLLPGWDVALWDELSRLDTKLFFLSGTMIQPHNMLDVGIVADYGDTVETFDEQRLLAEYRQYQLADWRGATWPPNLMHRDVWDMVGGYSIEFTPGMYSDPDLSAKLYMVGVRCFKGLSGCRVYHFETKSTGRVRRNDGHSQFLLKWGFSNSVLRKEYTGLGDPFGSASVSRRKRRPQRLKAVISLLLGKQLGPGNIDCNE